MTTSEFEAALDKLFKTSPTLTKSQKSRNWRQPKKHIVEKNIFNHNLATGISNIR